MAIRRLAAAALAAVLPVTVVAAPGADAAPTPDAGSLARADVRADTAAAPRVVRLGGVRVRLRKGTRQVVTVNHRSGHHARVTFWRKRGGDWKRLRTTRNGRIGYGGLVRGPKRRQGTGTTPLGTYDLPRAFGNAPRPKRAELPYHRVHQGDYWVQDNRSRFYSQRRHKGAGGFRWWLPSNRYNSSERLRDYGAQYAWSIVINYNRPNPVRHRGSGIFLHVNGNAATAGCVSAPRPFIRTTLARLRSGLRPVIAIGR